MVNPAHRQQPMLDMDRLLSALLKRMQDRGISRNQVMRECGLSHSTFTRLSTGSGPSGETLVRLLLWLDHTDVSAFLTVAAPGKD